MKWYYVCKENPPPLYSSLWNDKYQSNSYHNFYWYYAFKIYQCSNCYCYIKTQGVVVKTSCSFNVINTFNAMTLFTTIHLALLLPFCVPWTQANQKWLLAVNPLTDICTMQGLPMLCCQEGRWLSGGMQNHGRLLKLCKLQVNQVDIDLNTHNWLMCCYKQFYLIQTTLEQVQLIFIVF